MSLTVYTGPTGNGRKPTILLNFLNIQHTLHLFPWPTPEIKKDWYLKINPSGLVPSIVDGDITMHESNAILLYLADKYDTDGNVSYIKTIDPTAYWKQVQWLFFQSTQFTNATKMLLSNKHTKTTDEHTLARTYSALEKVYSVLEDQLSKNKFINGEKFTIVDIAFICGHFRMLERVRGTEYEIKNFAEKYPDFNQWYTTSIAIKEVKKGLEKVAAAT
ncbi:uncharacterized protein J8A68_001164 [[Candida] subhashii]|uniref:Glutathione S-transferase n=1 Tax=[Candida] subhashii TaxID=561895 RepID=A0A8J5URE1_9ASCO|nr:uncharacterized protein J8A68_001164 [[Candida] subhashii]KAG7665476.1 hypothetical protein J8A68_001164 [[Candida] subhashii]